MMIGFDDLFSEEVKKKFTKEYAELLLNKNRIRGDVLHDKENSLQPQSCNTREMETDKYRK